MANEAATLTPFERDVLDWILRGDDPVLEVLRQQMAGASVGRRTLTGVGFWLDLTVPADLPRTDEWLGTRSDFAFGGVGALFEDANIEAGFVLFVKGGRIKLLEGYTYGDTPWPHVEDKGRLFYFDGEQNVARLRKTWQR